MCGVSIVSPGNHSVSVVFPGNTTFVRTLSLFLSCLSATYN